MKVLSLLKNGIHPEKLGDANRCHKCNRLSFIGFQSRIKQVWISQCHFSIREPVWQVTDFITQLNTATNGIGSEFDSLIASYQTLIEEMSTTATLHDLAQSKVLAKDGLKQAADNGFSVSSQRNGK
ncbi:hypothetical protein O9993_15925 [Vibrio lentus]|nr:hypothetical protein [Vibrio lentus]